MYSRRETSNFGVENKGYTVFSASKRLLCLRSSTWSLVLLRAHNCAKNPREPNRILPSHLEDCIVIKAIHIRRIVLSSTQFVTLGTLNRNISFTWIVGIYFKAIHETSPFGSRWNHHREDTDDCKYFTIGSHCASLGEQRL